MNYITNCPRPKAALLEGGKEEEEGEGGVRAFIGAVPIFSVF